MQNQYKGRLDLASMMITVLCLVHCLLFPVLLAGLPATAGLLHQGHWPETATIIAAIVVGGTAVGRGLRRHRNMGVLLFFITGMLMMFIANLVPESSEMVLRLSGAALTGYAHLRNYQLACRCRSCI